MADESTKGGASVAGPRLGGYTPGPDEPADSEAHPRAGAFKPTVLVSPPIYADTYCMPGSHLDTVVGSPTHGQCVRDWRPGVTESPRYVGPAATRAPRPEAAVALPPPMQANTPPPFQELPVNKFSDARPTYAGPASTNAPRPEAVVAPQGAPPPIQRAAQNTTPHPLASHPRIQMMRLGWKPPGIR